MLNGLRGEVSVRFVDIGRIVDYYWFYNQQGEKINNKIMTK
jgi:hypothetical protein